MRKTTSSTGIARRHNVRPEGKRVASIFQHQRSGQLRWAEDVLTPLTHYFPAEAAHYPAPGGQWTWQLTCCVMCTIFNWREGNQGDMQQTGAGCREPIQSLVNMRNSRQCSDGSSQHHTWTPPDYNYLAGAQSSSGQSQTERREVSDGQRSVCTYNTLPFYRAYIYQLIDIDFIYMPFSARSALPSSPLQHLSNKSAPARLFNKHFAPSDECAALLKCLFSFCLGGQPTVVYLTVNKGPESLQLHASSPQWSLAASLHFSGGGKSSFRPADSLSEFFNSVFALMY